MQESSATSLKISLLKPMLREEFETGECETRDSCSDTLSDESECHLYCQYFERSTPYGRVPLMDKLTEQKLTRKEGISFSCLRLLAKIKASLSLT
ncbi:hypothetical protein HN51_022329 [Arachis hypogaea]